MAPQRDEIFDLLLPISEHEGVMLGEATRADLDAAIALLPESDDPGADEWRTTLCMFRAGLDDDTITVFESCTVLPGVQFVPEPLVLDLDDWE
jgi:hypothetical protein